MISYLLATFLVNPEMKLVQKSEQNYGVVQSQGFAMQVRTDLHTLLFDYRQYEQSTSSGIVQIKTQSREYSMWRNEFFYEGFFYGFGLGQVNKSVTTIIGSNKDDDQGKPEWIYGPRFGFEKEYVLPEEMKLLIVADSRFLYSREFQPHLQPTVGLRIGLAY